MPYVFANNVNTSLASGISSGATSMTLSSSVNLPSLSAGQIFVLTLNDAATQLIYEVVYVTAIAGAVCTITRAQEGTTALAWLAGDRVWATITQGALTSLAAAAQIQVYSSGSGTYTVPTINGVLPSYLEVEMVAGGGGGGGSVSSGSGTGGGNTTFGTSLLTANGGSVGTVGTGGGGGAISTGGSVNVPGATGGQGLLTINGTGGNGGGIGGASFFGGGGAGAPNASAGNAAVVPGSGGQGGGTDGTTTTGVLGGGGGGAGSYCFAIITTVLTSYAYTVGVGGTGATGTGTGSHNGGNGAPGYIKVKAYW